MNKLILLFTVIILTFSSCKKDPASSADEITYEVSTTSGGFLSIVFLDETEASTHIQNHTSSNWTTSFKNKAGRPRTLMLSALSDLFGKVPADQMPIITLKIYLNGAVVKTATGSSLYTPLQYNLN